MPVTWPQNLKHHYRVLHPINTHGTTWLRESDLVFLKQRPYAVLSWEKKEDGEQPLEWCELNPKMLKHDPNAGPIYRYEGEIQDPAG